MTEIRKEAMEMLERVPEDKLCFVIRILQGVNGLLEISESRTEKEPVDWDGFVVPSERGQNVEEYMKEMRANDRL